jgi:hypothetical protein
MILNEGMERRVIDKELKRQGKDGFVENGLV